MSCNGLLKCLAHSASAGYSYLNGIDEALLS
jgi:hypothetical protein